jgi:hypothetical protein
MKMNKIVTASLLLCASLSMEAQTESGVYIPGSNAEGITYFLPKTGVRICLEIEKREVTPGEFSRFAERYLHQKDVATSASTTYTIKSIQLQEMAVADKDKAFTIKLKDKTVAPLMSLTRDGVLLSINKKMVYNEETPEEKSTVTNNYIDAHPYFTGDLLSAGSTSKMAELAAQEIYDIRDSRSALIRGEADNTPKDGAQLKLMLDQLSTQETALQQLFTGSEKVTVSTQYLTIVPEEGMEKEVCFRFSQKLGLVDKDDLSGTPYYMSIPDLKTCPEPDEETLKALEKKKAASGVFYAVPGKGLVEISSPTQVLLKKEVSFAQMGNVELLSGSLFNKKETVNVTFNPTSGAIETVEGE